MEETIIVDEELPMTEVPKEAPKVKKQRKTEQVPYTKESTSINCLRHERIIIRHISKQSGLVTNPKHILYGGMAENSVKTYVVPRLSSGMYVNVLTDNEKEFLEEIMGLEHNALSIYRKEGNFWDDSNDNGISRVRLHKQDNFLDLSDPEDYIRYKILLANKDFIAPSMQALEDSPKATYEYVIIEEGAETKMAKSNMTTTMQCYKEFGKVENDMDKLRVVIETIDGRPLAPNTQLEFLQAKVNDLIQSNGKLFLKVITDPLLDTKVLIKKSLEAGLLFKKGNFIYLSSDNSPLCGPNEDPTLNVAARYINLPKNQQLKLSLEAKSK